MDRTIPLPVRGRIDGPEPNGIEPGFGGGKSPAVDVAEGIAAGLAGTEFGVAEDEGEGAIGSSDWDAVGRCGGGIDIPKAELASGWAFDGNNFGDNK